MKEREGGSFYYNFEDGWVASVRWEVKTATECRRIVARSKGFCGYDWMIDEILKHGRILTRGERLKDTP
jgi:hypothetical protein